MALHAYQFNFRQVEACVTTWRKPWRRWTEKKTTALDTKKPSGMLNVIVWLVALPPCLARIASKLLSRLWFPPLLLRVLCWMVTFPPVRTAGN